MCEKKNISDFIKKLHTISQLSSDSIQKEVALEALTQETPENICHFFKDLRQYGCVSGMVGSLIYYSDTEKFFDKYYKDIIWPKIEYEEKI